MNGIKMSECKFYVDEEKRTVICVIPKTRDMLIDFIQDHFDFRDVDLSHSTYFRFMNDKLAMPNSFIGKAVCTAEDEWNEETGRMIAFSRAKDKCYKSFFKRANKFVQAIDRRLGDAIELFNDFGLKLESKRAALQNQIDERTNAEKE